jgi:regulator of replication initiation timing
MKRKNPCKEKIVSPKENSGLKCPFCEKDFSNKYNMLRHINTNVCKAKKQMVKIVEENNKLRTENRNLQLQINSNNTTVNSNNNMTQNITIVAYGKEDIEKLLTDNDFKSIMRRGMLSVPELVRRIHFDEKVPENHNVYISNLRNKYILTYDGNRWRLSDREEKLQTIYDDHSDILERKFDDLIESLDKTTVAKFQAFLNYVNSNPDNSEEDIEDDDDQRQPNRYVEMVKEDIKKVLYENRDIVEKTKKQQ